MTTPRTLRAQATDELIEKLKDERDSARRELELDEHYNAGYCAGQEAARKYSLQVCTERGLVNPVIKLKET